ncbi:hypothetical protein [Pseudomonas luteola]|uniref:hypothetical protein n=1 Tax=Pseudomonas luteola TaxID=47886 RepID=UPI0015E2C450|nr:hypothetical protein [Pseudomonas zeshuii]MBA1249883.1 hypothetical protein [Pseudomonas zeshuii]
MAIALSTETQAFFSNSAFIERRSSLAEVPKVPLRSMSGEIREAHCYFAKVTNIEVNIQVNMPVYLYKRTSSRRITMKEFIDLDLHDVAVMVGLGSFAGSASGIAWSLCSSAPMPSSVAILFTVAGFIGGKLATHHTRRTRHVRN